MLKTVIFFSFWFVINEISHKYSNNIVKSILCSPYKSCQLNVFTGNIMRNSQSDTLWEFESLANYHCLVFKRAELHASDNWHAKSWFMTKNYFGNFFLHPVYLTLLPIHKNHVRTFLSIQLLSNLFRRVLQFVQQCWTKAFITK